MDAVDALSEIAFWLERDLAPTFKVQAFRRAASLISDLDPAELADRVHDGRLRAMKGIGGRTAEVIGQSLYGLPDYLDNLRRRGAEPLAPGGGEVLALLRGDLHTHSDWSDGTTSINLMITAARLLGREYLTLTDHSPSLTVAHGLTADRLEEQLDLVASLNAGGTAGGTAGDTAGAGFRLLSGIEVDILENGELDQDPALMDRLDVVVASVHSKLRADSLSMTRRMLAGIREAHTNVLGHCTGRLVTGSRGTRPPSSFDAARVFAACAENAVAVEINSRPERQDPPDDLIALALAAGCLFSIDSDAHAPGHLDFLAYGAERAAANGVPAERIVNTWPVEKLLDWSRASR
ncbi:PHP domain-containing protein [Cryobacterium adonitolivorans]|uniref:PHP domain-containing protein n=1 Tax=Cryobacterium adonitolivorans TaxID=1259189 RepID=A0A4R8VZR0_9MICO|nr:PHP domain-containing protein [Cryobacterium adonitolivorans]TFB97507.1 PHP domain-containing protein [Cryobacterium adonitolivorans]